VPIREQGVLAYRVGAHRRAPWQWPADAPLCPLTRSASRFPSVDRSSWESLVDRTTGTTRRGAGSGAGSRGACGRAIGNFVAHAGTSAAIVQHPDA
jgi:hypothetical protein